MKRLSNIQESIWTNINKRSEGNLDRKEDERGNIRELKPIDIKTSVLWADQDLHVDDIYWFNHKDAERILNGTGWRLPTLEEAEELYFLLNKENFKREKEKYIFTVGDNTLIFNGKGFQYGDSDKIMNPEDYHSWTSTVSSATNETHFKLSMGPLSDKETRINCSYPFHDMNKLCVRPVRESMNESIWTNINKRSEGSIVRKEDDINLFSREDFVNYLKKTYISNMSAAPVIDINNSLYFNFMRDKHFPILRYPLIIIYDNDNKIVSINVHMRMSDNKKIFKYLQDNFTLNLNDNNEYVLISKNGLKPSYSMFIDLIDACIERIEPPYMPMIKKERT